MEFSGVEFTAKVALTPGDTLPVTTDEICEPGYSKFVRRYIDGRTKAELYREYGLVTTCLRNFRRLRNSLGDASPPDRE